MTTDTRRFKILNTNNDKLWSAVTDAYRSECSMAVNCQICLGGRISDATWQSLVTCDPPFSCVRHAQLNLGKDNTTVKSKSEKLLYYVRTSCILFLEYIQ